MERATEITEDYFVSCAAITVKKDKSVMIALDFRKPSEVTVKRKTQMPIMEELIARISRKISEGTDGEILAKQLDFDYAYGQIKLDESTKNLCIFHRYGRRFHRILPFPERFLRNGELPTIFQKRVDTTLEHKHMAWLDDIIVVTKGNMDKHEAEVRQKRLNWNKQSTD